MGRGAFSVTVAIVAVLGFVGGAATLSGARADGRSGPVTAALPLPAEFCTEAEIADWETVTTVQPPGPGEALTVPAASPSNELYLVEIALPPGTCMPYAAIGNQRDGATFMIVQEGAIEYRWPRAVSGSTPDVRYGDATQPFGSVPEGTSQTLEAGHWVAQDQQVWFSYRNVGSDNAVISKAVGAAQLEIEGCGGGCK